MKLNTKSILSFIFIIIVISAVYITILIQPPKDFPSKQFYFNIPKGAPATKVADDLYNKKIISSPLLFKISVVLLSMNKGLKAGDYRIRGEESLFEIANRMINGYERQLKVRIVIPEGMRVADMAPILSKYLINFDELAFISEAKKNEGYLYPDTYDFFENASEITVIKNMKDNFNEKISTISDEIKKSKRSFKDIIIMASILEKEANGFEDKKIMSGILWKRIDKGMLLQVDPPFYYVLNKKTPLTYSDLKIDSLYNTYKYKGLPGGPIGSPSLESIKASLNPTESKYFFYLSGKDGTIHYSINYEGHLINKNKYLK